MNPKFCIISDGSCDIPGTLARQHQIDIVHFPVSFDGIHYKKEGLEIELSELYRQMLEHPDVYPPLLPRRTSAELLKNARKRAGTFSASAFPPS